jgi:hypothetical protein
MIALRTHYNSETLLRSAAAALVDSCRPFGYNPLACRPSKAMAGYFLQRGFTMRDRTLGWLIFVVVIAVAAILVSTANLQYQRP